MLLCICLSFPVIVESVTTENTPQVGYSKGLLTLKTYKTPLVKVLEAISKAAELDIFVAKDLIPDDVSIQLTEVPIQDALKRILIGTNYAAIFFKEGEALKLTALKVFPEGKYDGELIPIAAASKRSAISQNAGKTKTVLVRSGQEVAAQGTLMNSGILVPIRSKPVFQDGQVPTWFVLQKQLERKEAQKYEELMHHKMKFAGTEDLDRKKALAVVYAEEVAKFYDMKKAHLNKIESLKRIQHLRELTK